MLHRDPSIPPTCMAFDVLALDGEPTVRLPYVERVALLEELVQNRATMRLGEELAGLQRRRPAVRPAEAATRLGVWSPFGAPLSGREA
jgi:ATP-dependent DNA ligase